MSGRGVMAQKALKAKKQAIAEMTYKDCKRVASDYEGGHLPWPSEITESRKNALIARNKRAEDELRKYGIIV